METEQRIAELGLTLPPEPTLPPGLSIPFSWVRVHGDRAFVSGHGAQAPDGAPSGPFGQVPTEVTLEAAQEGARLTALTVIAALQRALGDLDRIAAWLVVSGFVNADPGYAQTTAVLNGFSNVVLDVFGPDRGAHARTAIGVSALPLNSAVIVAAEVALA